MKRRRDRMKRVEERSMTKYNKKETGRGGLILGLEGRRYTYLRVIYSDQGRVRLLEMDVRVVAVPWANSAHVSAAFCTNTLGTSSLASSCLVATGVRYIWGHAKARCYTRTERAKGNFEWRPLHSTSGGPMEHRFHFI